MYLKNVSILVFAFLISSCQSFKNYDQKTYDKIGFSENDFNFTNEDTAYHRLLPSGTKIKVTNMINNKSVFLNIKNNPPLRGFVKISIIKLLVSKYSKLIS